MATKKKATTVDKDATPEELGFTVSPIGPLGSEGYIYTNEEDGLTFRIQNPDDFHAVLAEIENPTLPVK